MANIGLSLPANRVSAPVVGETIANWNTAEQDVLMIGESGVVYWPALTLINIGFLTPGAVITIRAYMVVNEVEQQIGEDDYTVGVDYNIQWFSGLFLFAFHEPVRITAQSDTPADNGLPIKYDYIIERH